MKEKKEQMYIILSLSLFILLRFTNIALYEPRCMK